MLLPLTQNLRRLNVAAVTVTITSIQYPADGSVVVKWSDGNESSYPSRAALLEAVEEAVTADKARLMLLSAWAGRSPTLNDPSWATRRQMQVDLSRDLGPVLFGEA